MFDALGNAVVRHPWRALVAWLVIVVTVGAGALWGYGYGGIFDRLQDAVTLVPGTESDQVNTLSAAGAGPTLTIVVDGVAIPDDVPQISQFLSVHRTEIAAIDGVDDVLDAFQAPDLRLPQAQALLSTAQDGFVVVVRLAPDSPADDQVMDRVNLWQDQLRADLPGATVRLVSPTLMSDSVMDQIRLDLIRGESVGLPVALVLLIIVFGGFLAAGLPIVGALVAIAVGMGALWGMTFAIDVEAFTINIASIIGLALSVDYGLLIVSRYREELALSLADHGYPADGSRAPRQHAATAVVRQAMRATVRTAGRTVFFSALTIAVALCALLTMKASMMRTIAAAGIAVTLLAVATAITLVPAIVVILRRRLIKPSLITRVPGVRAVARAVGDSASDHGFFSRLARGVHHHPWLVMAMTAFLLAFMASPLRELELRTAFVDYLPESAPVTVAYDIIQRDYPGLVAPSIIVIADAAPDRTADLVAHLTSLPDADFVSAPVALASDPGRSVINVHIDQANQVGQEVTGLVTDLRQFDAGFDILVGGPAALQLDFVDSIVDRAVPALGIMVAAVFILMFLMTGSLVVPLKAILINSFSLLASLGATTHIFMNGWLGMPQVLGMETFILVCAVCFGFGLAMDYEVFLIARVKEYWDQGYANDEAVERGLQRSGRIITSAAAIIVAVFIGFTFGDMVPIKQIGVALAITVVTDATLVRLMLVPATMTILGKWNWWAPRPLRWVYGKLGLVH